MITGKARYGRLRKSAALRNRYRNELVALYGRNCWLCGRAIADGAKISLDHVQPASKGGSNKIDNLRPAHEKCNRRRGNGGIPVLLLTADMKLRPLV